MNKFEFKSKYATYKDCYFQVGHYQNGNLALEIWNNTEGCINRPTVNPDVKIPTTHIAVKDYSENEGTVDALKDLGIIEGDPTQIIRSGWVEIPVYALTSMAYEALVEGE